jgi:hypothetical protein
MTDLTPEQRDWIDDLPGIKAIGDVTFGELMVPLSKVREHYAALRTPVADAGPRKRVTGDYDIVWEDVNGNPTAAPVADAGLDAFNKRHIGATCMGPCHSEAFVRASAATPTEPDASFDDPVLDEDPAPSWKGGLLGTDHGADWNKAVTE